jgi:hypothetical protein
VKATEKLEISEVVVDEGKLKGDDAMFRKRGL